MSSVLNSNNNSGINFLLSLETRGIKLGLKRTRELLKCCGNPQNNLKSIQIIGTNGKGSTAATLSSILLESGMNVGMYTSPHLVHLSERIQINGLQISNDDINSFINNFKTDIENLECTFFETMTVLAMFHFYNNNIDIAVLETGLGGKYDSVTACNPILQLFTKISMDHQHILGDTIQEIADDKSHAIQYQIPCISVNQDSSVNKILTLKAQEQDTSIEYISNTYSNDYHSPLLGEHQKLNILLAVHAAKKIKNIQETDIINGIKNTSWPGRLEVIQKDPIVIFDVCHNDDSVVEFCNTINGLNHKGKKILLIAMQHTKFFDSAIFTINNLFSKIICTKINDRMYDAKHLASLFGNNQLTHVIENPLDAISQAIDLADDSDLLAIIGSHYWGEMVYKNF